MSALARASVTATVRVLETALLLVSSVAGLLLLASRALLPSWLRSREFEETLFAGGMGAYEWKFDVSDTPASPVLLSALLHW